MTKGIGEGDGTVGMATGTTRGSRRLGAPRDWLPCALFDASASAAHCPRCAAWSTYHVAVRQDGPGRGGGSVWSLRAPSWYDARRFVSWYTGGVDPQALEPRPRRVMPRDGGSL